MKILLPIFSFFFIFASCERENKNTSIATMTKTDSTKNINAYNLKPFSIFPLDSIMSKVCGKSLIEIQVNQMDSIKKYTALLDLFKTNGLQNLFYKTTINNNLQSNKNTVVPGLINQMTFDNAQNASVCYRIFMDEIIALKIKGKIAIKAGGICFLHDKTIYLIPISTCENFENINLFEKIIRENVFKGETFEGIKMYCSLSKSELIK